MRGIVPVLIFFWFSAAESLPYYLKSRPNSDVRSHLDELEQFMEGRKKDREDILDGVKKTTNTVFGDIPNAGEIFEGDIIMDDDLRNAVLGVADKRSVITDKEKLWPNATVPYKFDKSIAKKSKRCVLNAFASFHYHTCIRFVKRTTEKDYLQITSSPNMCSSYIGRQGGKQAVHIGHGCTRIGTCQHELLHALGMIHEQSRPERDQHVRIIWDNIKKKEQHNFNKYQPSHVRDAGVPYNFASVMHYPNHAFALDRSVPTIVSKKDPNLVFGQRKMFSEGDVTAINRLYGCGTDPNSDELIAVLSDSQVEEDLKIKEQFS